MLREYIVTKELLNIRSRPTEESEFKGNLKLNTKVWLDDQEIVGTVPLGGETNKWLVYNSSLFVAKDGVSKSGFVKLTDGISITVEDYISERFDETTKKIKAPIDYNFLLNIPKAIKQTKGSGVAIGILDSAISKGINLNNKIIRPFGISIPNDNHASFLSGIIAGNSSILGIAPDVTLIELAIFDEKGNMRFDKIDSIFDFITSYSKPIILNVSQNIPPVTQQFFLKNFMDLKNTIIVASAGLDMLTVDDLINFPASLSNVISVGCLSSQLFESSDIKFNKELDFILPSFNYVSYSKDQVQYESNLDTSSIGTAIVSAVVALLISNGVEPNHTNIKSSLSLISQPFTKKDSFNFLNIIKC